MSERDVFIAALQRDVPAQRTAFLDEACAGQPELRRQVENLLRLYEGAGSFLEKPAAPSAATGAFPEAAERASPIEAPGGAIGPYMLIEQIGEGGMGTAWMAQQSEPVKRVVAVKLIKAGMDSRQVIARFEAERQALALMDHANIARVLDAGTTDAGRPYFVMDLVRGVPITRYCDEHHLTPRQRLELFIPVCQAIQHAHQKGIIHRDLKPSNVLVALYDGQPVPKVIDFGVAKAAGQSLTDKTLVTGFGNIIGTLEYMSPEQAEVNQLDIDTRSDIYSLGVLLYELLTGTPPFSRKELEQAGMLEMLRVIREQEPSKPSTKLSTAEGLPTLAANRGTEPAKLTKLVRGELDWIVMKALEKDRNRRYETSNGFAQDVQRYLADEPVQACPPSAGYRLRKFARRNKGGLAMAALVLFFLMLLGSGIGWAVRDRSAREAAIAQERANREAEFKRQRESRQAKVAGQVESIFADVDRLEKERKWPEALAAARRAEAAVAGGEADSATAQRVRERLRDLALIDRLEQIRLQQVTLVEETFDNAGADRDYARAFREYGVDALELTVETSIDRLKTRPAVAIPLAAALDDWVQARRSVSERDRADWKRLVAVARGIEPEPLRDRLRSTWEQPISEVQADLRRLAESIDIRAQRPATLVFLARTLQRVKHSDSALRVLRDGQDVNPGDFWLTFELGSALNTRGDREGAVRYYTAAVSLRPTAAAAHNNLGEALRDQNKTDEAIACYRRAIELEPGFAGAYSNLGNALRKQKKLDEAVAACRRAIELNASFVLAHNNLGAALGEQGKLDEAIECFRRAIDLDQRYALAHVNLGHAHREQKKWPEAIDAYKKALTFEPPHPYAHYGLAWILATCPDARLRAPDQAVAQAEKAVALAPKDPVFRNALGVAYYRAGDWKAAIAALEKSMELRSGGNSFDWFFVAMAHWQLGEKDQAREWYERAVERMEKNQPTNGELRKFRAEAEELMKKD